MKRFLLFMLLAIFPSVLYAKDYEHKPLGDRYNGKCYLVYRTVESHNYIKYYKCIYAYNWTDKLMMFTIRYRRCTKSVLSDSRLSSNCSEQREETFYIAPKTSRQALLNNPYELPYLKVRGNWPWGFEVADFRVKVAE